MRRHDLITYPTWQRYTVLSHAIARLSIRDRRRIFQLARAREAQWDRVFFPEYGFTLSEFAVWYTLGDHRRRR